MRLTAALLTAIALLIVVHRTIFTGLFATLRFRSESGGANRCHQNGKQNFRHGLHAAILRVKYDKPSKRPHSSMRLH
jgi:hypothetical protein